MAGIVISFIWEYANAPAPIILRVGGKEIDVILQLLRQLSGRMERVVSEISKRDKLVICLIIRKSSLFISPLIFKAFICSKS